jgi:transposase-like protein
LIDGVWLTREICVVVAVGIDTAGSKRVLDFEQGTSENITVVAALIERLAARGVEAKGRRLLVGRDGSQAIATAIGRVWPEAVQQECLVHAHSNLRDKLRRRDRADLDIHFKRLREAQGRQAGEEAFDELLDFVSERNAAAALALENRKDALLAFHRLDVPSTLNVTFLSTNLIENVLRNWREATGNVKRWNEKEDMSPRWMASGLLWAEAGFRRIRHAEDLPRLASALALSTPSSAPAKAAASSSVASASAEKIDPCLSSTK